MGIQCCTEEGMLLNNTELLHPECLAIEIPNDDPFFSKFGQRCMSFVRSTPAPTFDCSFGHGEQVSRLEESLTVTVQQLMSTPDASRHAKHVLFIFL